MYKKYLKTFVIIIFLFIISLTVYKIYSNNRGEFFRKSNEIYEKKEDAFQKMLETNDITEKDIMYSFSDEDTEYYIITKEFSNYIHFFVGEIYKEQSKFLFLSKNGYSFSNSDRTAIDSKGNPLGFDFPLDKKYFISVSTDSKELKKPNFDISKFKKVTEIHSKIVKIKELNLEFTIYEVKK